MQTRTEKLKFLDLQHILTQVGSWKTKRGEPGDFIFDVSVTLKNGA